MNSETDIRLLLVDDSLLVRSLLRRIFHAQPDMEVVGAASSAEKAFALVGECSPGVVVVRSGLAGMGGGSLVQQLREGRSDLPLVVLGDDGAAVGSEDRTRTFVRPTDDGDRESWGALGPRLVAAVRDLTGRPEPTGEGSVGAATRPRLPEPATPFTLLAVGSSTGGPDALVEVFRCLPEDLPVPVVVVQHMPPEFTRQLAERLDGISPLRVCEGSANLVLQPGHAYVAPGGLHMELERSGLAVRLRTHEGPREHSCRPAVDPLFRSAARIYGAGVLGVVLTGMGADGSGGAASIREAGGRVLIQDQATSVVWGMPGAVHAAGLADEVHPLRAIAPAITRALCSGPRRARVGSRSADPGRGRVA